MAMINFDQVWEAVKTLSPDEMRRVRSLLDSLLANQEQPMTEEDEFAQELRWR